MYAYFNVVAACRFGSRTDAPNAARSRKLRNRRARARLRAAPEVEAEDPERTVRVIRRRSSGPGRWRRVARLRLRQLVGRTPTANLPRTQRDARRHPLPLHSTTVAIIIIIIILEQAAAAAAICRHICRPAANSRRHRRRRGSSSRPSRARPVASGSIRPASAIWPPTSADVSPRGPRRPPLRPVTHRTGSGRAAAAAASVCHRPATPLHHIRLPTTAARFDDAVAHNTLPVASLGGWKGEDSPR